MLGYARLSRGGPGSFFALAQPSILVDHVNQLPQPAQLVPIEAELQPRQWASAAPRASSGKAVVCSSVPLLMMSVNSAPADLQRRLADRALQPQHQVAFARKRMLW